MCALSKVGFLSRKPGERTQPQRRKINSELIFLESGQALLQLSFPLESKPVGCVSKQEARSHRLHARWGPLWNARVLYPTVLCLQVLLQVPRNMRDFPIVVWAMTLVMEV